jgi:hypothetical protein
MKNLCGKTRDISNPYEVWKGQVTIGGDVLNMEWRVLKKWQADDNKPYARYFCAVQSEATFGGFDYGDVYASEIKRFGTLVSKCS